MRRTLVLIGLLVLAFVVAVAAPASSTASHAAAASKPKCKHHRDHRHKRCRKKAGGRSSSNAGDSSGSGGSSGPPGRLLATESEPSSTELRLQLSRPSLSAGSAIIEQYNAGSDPHDLTIEKNGLAAFSFGTLEPGDDQRQTVTLTPGKYTLYCSLLNHRSLGMQATLTVN
jgi:hypothetical protein